MTTTPEQPDQGPAAHTPDAPTTTGTAHSADDAYAHNSEPVTNEPVTAEPATGEPQHAAPQSAPAKRGSLLPVVAALAVGALIGGAAGGGVVAAVLGGGQPPVINSGPSATTVTVNSPENATLVTGVVARAMPSVVTLQVNGGGSAGSGSGVILSEDGYVLTNSHVATLDGASATPNIRVTTADGRIWNATLIGADPIADLAVIQLEGATDLQPIEFADSDALNVGDRAIAIGAPLGLAGTVTNGIVSALNRSITVRSSAVPSEPGAPGEGGEEGETDDPLDFWNFDIPGAEPQTGRPSAPISLSVIQTDAAINPGNSGGALLNDEGQLIGINVAIATAGGSSAAGSIGVGFSIPANFAQRISNELIATGAASHGLLGATVTDAANTATSAVVGALIDSVVPGGPAELVGLRAGDIVTTFNGVPISNRIDLTAQVRVLAGGDSATLTFVRGERSQEVTVTLGELP